MNIIMVRCLSNKYSNAETAVYELTLGVTGLMLASRYQILPSPSTATEQNMTIMREVMTYGEDCYRQLTDRTEGFLDYFYEATPVVEIGLLNIGSRPSHRKQQDRSKSSIRALVVGPAATTVQSLFSFFIKGPQ